MCSGSQDNIFPTIPGGIKVSNHKPLHDLHLQDPFFKPRNWNYTIRTKFKGNRDTASVTLKHCGVALVCIVT